MVMQYRMPDINDSSHVAPQLMAVWHTLLDFEVHCRTLSDKPQVCDCHMPSSLNPPGFCRTSD